MYEKNYRFTYYGDLLGVSNVYSLDSQTAYSKLNDYYNTTFSILRGYCSSNPAVNVQMFSDSLLIFGEGSGNIVVHLQLLYFHLLRNGLLLRGAMVDKCLEIDPRLTMENFRKELPKDDTLARAVSLEKSQKGARFLIESRLVRDMFENLGVIEWMTHEGYLMDISPQISRYDICRRIVPTPDYKNYEVLYFWIPNSYYQTIDEDNQAILRQMTEVSKMVSSELSKHYRETIGLLRRSLERKKLTESQADAS